MLEFPEVVNISRQLRKYALGKSVIDVIPPTKPHKFCWFNGDVLDYGRQICGTKVEDVSGFGLFVEMIFSNGKKLCFNDGVNVRLLNDEMVSKDFQLLIKVEECRSLVFTVAMYGGIVLHNNDYDNEYYLKSKAAISPLSEGFITYFDELLNKSKPTMSIKAFLATEQRFPGIGNGVLQDILFAAGINPRRKIGSLNEAEKKELGRCTVDVIRQMTELGGRDTEKDLLGNVCGYKTVLSKNTMSVPCPCCASKIIKEPYLGGSVYYCPECQKIK